MPEQDTANRSRKITRCKHCKSRKQRRNFVIGGKEQLSDSWRKSTKNGKIKPFQDIADGTRQDVAATVLLR